MGVVIAAIRTGHDPVGKLPQAAFHRWLDVQILCPKCDATYNLVVDFDAAVGRHFEEDARRPIMMLRKAVMQGHFNGHRVTHFESAGVVVTSFTAATLGAAAEPPPKPVPRPRPAPRAFRVH